MIFPTSLMFANERIRLTVFGEDGAYWSYSIGIQKNEDGYLEMLDWKSGESLAISRSAHKEGKGLPFSNFNFSKRDIKAAVNNHQFKAEFLN